MFEQAPRPVIWAAALTVFNAVVGFAVAAVWPDIDDRGTLIVVGGVLTLLMLGATLWLWRRAKWGGIAFIAINAVNALSALPALFAGDAAFALDFARISQVDEHHSVVAVQRHRVCRRHGLIGHNRGMGIAIPFGRFT